MGTLSSYMGYAARRSASLAARSQASTSGVARLLGFRSASCFASSYALACARASAMAHHWMRVSHQSGCRLMVS